MANKGIQKARSDKMRSRIVDVALHLFAEKGIDQVTIAEIAAKAGCSPGNIYHYFKSKEAISATSTAKADAEYLIIEKKLREGKNKNLNAKERFLAFQTEMFTDCMKEPLGVGFYIYALKHPEENILKIDEHRASYHIYHRLFQDCIDQGFIRQEYSIDTLIQNVAIINRGVVIEWLVYQGGFDLAKTGTEISRIFLDGVCHKPSGA